MATVSKEEYLKRYLSGSGADGEKKKRKKKKLGKPTYQSRFTIVDDDVDVKALIPDNVGNTLDEDIDLDKPTVADVIDERPEAVQILEKYRNDKRWKVLDNDHTKSNRHDSDHGDTPPRRKRHDSDQDDSPPRRKRYDSDFDNSPPRRQRHDSGSDNSLSFRHNANSDSDDSPHLKRKHINVSEDSSHRKRHDSGDLDNSPPRRNRQDSDLDHSPPRKRRQDSDLDHSPRKRRQDSDLDNSPPRRKRQDSDLDNSPPRRKRQDSDLDNSPPRRKRKDSELDNSPPRKRRQDRDLDNSPPRRKRKDSDNSPARHGSYSTSSHRQRLGREVDASAGEANRSGERSKHFKNRSHKDRAILDGSPPRRGEKDKKMKETLGGAKAGLSTAREVREETAKLKKKEDEMFNKLDAEVLGKNAKTVFRDRESGRKRDLEEEARIEAEKAKHKSVRDEQYNKWGKGVAQLAQQEANVETALHEMSKPLSRFKDDEDLDSMLKDQDRDGDPMLAFMKKKRKKADPNVKELPRYKGPQPPPNRFNIWPGYRWDGVDRSNGFERKLVESKVNKKAIAEIAYKWSTEDM